MQDQSTAVRIKGFLNRQFPPTKTLGDEQPLLGGGLIDSLGILELVAFLEGEFKIAVADEELLPGNFGTVRELAEFVRKKQTGRCTE